jgi:hypothetical protein
MNTPSKITIASKVKKKHAMLSTPDEPSEDAGERYPRKSITHIASKNRLATPTRAKRPTGFSHEEAEPNCCHAIVKLWLS